MDADGILVATGEALVDGRDVDLRTPPLRTHPLRDDKVDELAPRRGGHRIIRVIEVQLAGGAGQRQLADPIREIDLGLRIVGRFVPRPLPNRLEPLHLMCDPPEPEELTKAVVLDDIPSVLHGRNQGIQGVRGAKVMNRRGEEERHGQRR